MTYLVEEQVAAEMTGSLQTMKVGGRLFGRFGRCSRSWWCGVGM